MFLRPSKNLFRYAICLATTAFALCTPLPLGHADEEPEPSARFILRSKGTELPLAAYLDSRSRRGFITLELGEARVTSPVYPLWKVMVSDLDGDGEDEIVLGIWSHRPRHDEPEPHRTIWVMRFDGESIVPRYRGSALARPLLDAWTVALDDDGSEELLAFERTGKLCWWTAYRWNGFGFSGVARRPLSCRTVFGETPGCIWARAGQRCARLREGELFWP